jgi:ribosomal protein S27E
VNGPAEHFPWSYTAYGVLCICGQPMTAQEVCPDDPARWFCEAHRRWTTTDCPKCDDEQIADLEKYAAAVTCHTCKRTLHEGELAWASDWTVITPDGSHLEIRYTCDDCEAA